MSDVQPIGDPSPRQGVPSIPKYAIGACGDPCPQCEGSCGMLDDHCSRGRKHQCDKNGMHEWSC